MKVWLTKYAMTEGIREVEAEVCAAGGGDMIKYGPQAYAHGEGRDWHRTLESAQKRANLMRQNKITTLEKQIAKMRAKVFA